ncbi:hypothetical protein B0H14DRAFT_3473659 [Mycena olivaceomarginata]|nr:hypothetical protein B0H14DRAFT_3473659 [Mycena olivaceomarginata]
MSIQLYGDSQTMVKNIVFTVAKQIELDLTREVNAYHDGTDPVEEHFGFSREIGGHNSAMNFKQGVEWSGWECDIRGVHQRNPGLHAGHQRRNITRAEIKDHLNEYNFTGDYVVGNCDLVSSWRSGRTETMRIFSLYSKMSSDKYDIPAILASKPGLDFMRPHGDGIYPGIADNTDRSLPPETTKAPESSLPETIITPPSSTPATSQIVPVPSTQPADPDFVDDLLPDLNIPLLSFEEALQSEETEPEALKLEPRTGVNPNDYLVDEHGKFMHKASMCRLALNKNFVEKSKNRGERAMGLTLKRVRTFTNPNAARPLDGSLTGASFINGDLFLTLIRTSTNISLAVVRSTEILVDGSRKPSVNFDSIKNPKANIKLTGQILRLKAVPALPEDAPESVEISQATSESTLSWLWLGSYLMGKSIMKGTKIATDAPLWRSKCTFNKSL